MSFTNSTTNYGLPQYVSTDIPSYLVDQNGAWSTIDTNLKSVSDVAGGASSTATAAQSAASAAQTTATSALNKADGALSNQADTYISTETYDVGDHVIYNSILYVCNTAITTPEAFDSSKWTRVTLENMIDTVENMIDTVENTVDTIETSIGDTDISSIGDGTITDAISTINTNLSTSLTSITRLATFSASASSPVTANIGNINNYKYLYIICNADNFIDCKILPVSLILHMSSISGRGYEFRVYSTSSYQWIGHLGFYSVSSGQVEVSTQLAPTTGWTPNFSIYGIK